MTKTADGRDLTNEEWRTIPEFPKYEMTADGDVRNRETGKLLREHLGNGSWFYTLWKGPGQKSSRGTGKLIKTVWS